MELDGFPLNGEQPVNLRHELGIMFGFLAACILTVAVYYIFWQGIPPHPKGQEKFKNLLTS